METTKDSKREQEELAEKLLAAKKGKPTQAEQKQALEFAERWLLLLDDTEE